MAVVVKTVLGSHLGVSQGVSPEKQNRLGPPVVPFFPFLVGRVPLLK